MLYQKVEDSLLKVLSDRFISRLRISHHVVDEMFSVEAWAMIQNHLSMLIYSRRFRIRRSQHIAGH